MVAKGWALLALCEWPTARISDWKITLGQTWRTEKRTWVRSPPPTRDDSHPHLNFGLPLEGWLQTSERHHLSAFCLLTASVSRKRPPSRPFHWHPWIQERGGAFGKSTWLCGSQKWGQRSGSTLSALWLPAWDQGQSSPSMLVIKSGCLSPTCPMVLSIRAATE